MTPTLLSCKSIVITCGSCNHWIERRPAFLGDDLGKGFGCDWCGCTSVHIRPGRPYGPKSKDWANVLSWFENVWQHIEPEEFDLVTTEPPMAKAEVEAWG